MRSRTAFVAWRVLDLSEYSVETTGEEMLPFFQTSWFLADAGLAEPAMRLQSKGTRLSSQENELSVVTE
jgi:hypothetical protein